MCSKVSLVVLLPSLPALPVAKLSMLISASHCSSLKGISSSSLTVALSYASRPARSPTEGRSRWKSIFICNCVAEQLCDTMSFTRSVYSSRMVQGLFDYA